MLDMQIVEMAQLIAIGINHDANKIEHDTPKIEKILRDYWSKEIALTWSIEDVLDRAEGKGIKLSDKEAKEILRTLLKRHDASVGVNWDVLDYYIEDLTYTKKLALDSIPELGVN